MHGISKATQARSTVTRAFWLTVLGIAGATFFYQFVHLLLKYFSYHKKVTVEVSNTPVPFPSVSLCNMRHLDNFVLDEINRIFHVTQDPREWTDAANNPFVSSYMDSIGTYANMFVNNTINEQEYETLSSRTSISTNIMLRSNRSLLIEGGVPFYEFVVGCTYASTNCGNETSFRQFFDIYYYNCYTFNPPSLNREGGGELLAEGVENGLSVTLMVGSGMLSRNKDVRYIPGIREHRSALSGNEPECPVR